MIIGRGQASSFAHMCQLNPPPLLFLILTTDETGIFQHEVLLVFLRPESAKCVDHDTEGQYHHKEESEVIKDAEDKHCPLLRSNKGGGRGVGEMEKSALLYGTDRILALTFKTVLGNEI